MFTIVVGYRNRDLALARRCLDSLQTQTFHDFSVIFVDYGSDTKHAQAAKALTNAYDFVTYIYSDTRGYPWNRAHALNTGIRLAQPPYVITTDTDMLFPANFLEVVARHADQQHVLYCATHFLPREFSDWQQPEKHLATLPRGNTNQLGGFQCIATTIMHEIRGFDEYYRYWGLEDIDLKGRLEQHGLSIRWLNDETYFFHQWHPPANIYRQGFVPHSFWIHAVLYNQTQHGSIVRNDDNWGRIITTEDRPVFQYIDVNTQTLLKHTNVTVFNPADYNLTPADPEAAGRLMNVFGQLESGAVMVIPHASFPERNVWTQRILHYGNRFLRVVAGKETRIDMAPNLVHQLVAEMVYHRDLVEDYYLNLDVDGGVSVLIRR